ncbi:hypothetical protein CMV30_18600 [Nibricoccus aquaticus]|uniref:D-serine dehydratase-like domain-containing protein n=1 Tax=Nibricoccus aquaticus TaxID=2576891 RepID=A0A290QHL7_9BACT|nr:alanine racemase [Nibricoccus aquaticus]ATC65796.1 hypothetical protein CMV30_18600 [Nibricoccus aquaticus]
MNSVDDLPTPALLVNQSRLVKNIRAMQSVCDAHGVELRPHIKTHKSAEIAHLQLANGARGLTCAKLSEAEAILPSGVRSLFIAHSLVDLRLTSRLNALAEKLEDLRLAVTSEAHLEAFERLAAKLSGKVQVMLALDTGLGREGARDQSSAQALAAKISRYRHLQLRGFYTHEGHFYGHPLADQTARLNQFIERLLQIRDAIDPSLPLWPGCSVTAKSIAAATSGKIQSVRPGAYVFGDLALTEVTGVMQSDEVALHVLASVVDKPAPGLALIDAGSKTFSSDRTPAGIFARAADGRDLTVVRVNEEHGYVTGQSVDQLKIGERVAFTPAHVCTVVNLASKLVVTEGGEIHAIWPVDARGCSQ